MKKLLYFTLLYCAYGQAQDLGLHDFQWLLNKQEDNSQLFNDNTEIYPENNPLTPEDHSEPIDFLFSEYLSQFTQNNKVTIDTSCEYYDDYMNTMSPAESDNLGMSSSTTYEYSEADKENVMPLALPNPMHGKTEEGIIYCRVCNQKGFADPGKFKRHAPIHIKTPDKIYSCEQCQGLSHFSSQKGLNDHKRKLHNIKAYLYKDKMYHCSLCLFKNKSKSLYNEHIKTHTRTGNRIHDGLY